MSENGGNLVPPQSLEDKLSILERRFSELEKKHIDLLAEVHGKKEHKTEPVPIENAKDTKAGGVNPTKTEDSLSPKLKSRVRIVTSRIDTETKERKDFDSDKALQDSKSSRLEYALLLRKTIDGKEGDDGEIEIYDADLLNLLRKLLEHYPGHFFEGDTVTIPSPYEPLIQNWDLLWEESQKEGSEKDQKAKSDLRELLETILKGSGDTRLDSYMQMRDSLKKQSCITFTALWTIFPPGTIVYGRLFLRRHQIFIVEDSLEVWPKYDQSSRSNTWDLQCWTYDFTGKDFLRKAVILSFQAFQGMKPISSLPYHPLEDNDKREEIQTELLKSGKMFRKYCTAEEGDRMYKYSGQPIFNWTPEEQRNYELRRILSQGDKETDRQLNPPQTPAYPLTNIDVMVDFKSYYQYGSTTSRIGETTVLEEIYDCHCSECSSNEVLRERFKPHYDNMTGKEDEEWEDLQIMLCPPRVFGYVLQDKQWAQLAVDSLGEIPDENLGNAMSGLYLEGEDNGKVTKDLLYGLVKNHGAGKAKKENKAYELDDIVAEKGKGLVILLYGAPGVGKTSTAQMVAKAARKPLFPISVADIGTQGPRVESNLHRIFDLATTWKAILLIDEADVFLQSRTQGAFGPSAERSALVSVFLRFLEYYRGILFLTTNQIAQFDIAVQSRVHIALKYEELTKKQTKDIFLEFVCQYHKKGVVNGIKKLEDYAERNLYRKKFDGRQIRNIVTCAMGYARARGEKMTLSHIEHVVSYVEDFKHDLAGQMMKWQEMQKGTSMS